MLSLMICDIFVPDGTRVHREFGGIGLVLGCALGDSLLAGLEAVVGLTRKGLWVDSSQCHRVRGNKARDSVI